MAMDTIPLAMPPDLLKEVKRTARQTQLSSADIMRQAIKAGLPQVREALRAKTPQSQLKPFTKKECEQAWGPKTDGGESDQIAAAMSKVRLPHPEE
jgi:Ribbon-helix-helix protein, copG family